MHEKEIWIRKCTTCYIYWQSKGHLNQWGVDNKYQQRKAATRSIHKIITPAAVIGLKHVSRTGTDKVWVASLSKKKKHGVGCKIYENVQKQALFTWQNLELRNGDGNGGGFVVVLWSPLDGLFAISKIPQELTDLRKFHKNYTPIYYNFIWVISNF